MMKRLGNLKWIAGIAAVLVLMASVPTTTEAGRRYSGADPILFVNGHKINIKVEWPSNNDCDISGPIQVDVRVPVGVSYEFMGESFAEHGGCFQQTQTNIRKAGDIGENIAIEVMVPSDSRFSVKARIDVNNQKVREYKGSTNSVVTGQWVWMSELETTAASSGESDSGDDELTYTYEQGQGRDRFYWQGGNK